MSKKNEQNDEWVWRTIIVVVILLAVMVVTTIVSENHRDDLREQYYATSEPMVKSYDGDGNVRYIPQSVIDQADAEWNAEHPDQN